MRFYSDEWVTAFNEAVTGPQAGQDESSASPDGRPDHAGAVRVGGVAATPDGDFRLLHVVHDGPEGTVRIGLESVAGVITMTREPPDDPAPQVTLSVAYADAAALSRGDLDPAGLIATGRVKVRGDLSVLVGGQALLAAVARRVAALSTVTEY
jgi:hypothetical protein